MGKVEAGNGNRARLNLNFDLSRPEHRGVYNYLRQNPRFATRTVAMALYGLGYALDDKGKPIPARAVPEWAVQTPTAAPVSVEIQAVPAEQAESQTVIPKADIIKNIQPKPQDEEALNANLYDFLDDAELAFGEA